MNAKNSRSDPCLLANPNPSPFLQSRAYNPMNQSLTEPKFIHFDPHPPPSDPSDLKEERVSIASGGSLCCEEREGPRVCVWSERLREDFLQWKRPWRFVEEEDKIRRLG
ncbi:Anaphase-promoting complex, subunit 1 (IC) [Corchorus olitorius]|uniref:Anaphase-promoting complex, subunit 1 (IC) n=1 Tax=Corchorus olitorius TaxID=93759 RepID=A0A1R3GFJ3_9ROSI|nr:Anaphase-promoting complex, subunit 1 (IC) [Corchorus olitorius]